MQAKQSVLSMTYFNTDIGKVLVDGEFGWRCESNDADTIYNIVQTVSQVSLISQIELDYLIQNYLSAKSYNIITKVFLDE